MELLNREVSGDMVTSTFFDEMAGKVFVKREQDTTPYVERAQALSEYWNSDARRNHEMYYAGTIPNVVVEKYCTDKGITFREFMMNPVHHRRILNDPDFAKLRVWKGQL